MITKKNSQSNILNLHLIRSISKLYDDNEIRIIITTIDEPPQT